MPKLDYIQLVLDKQEALREGKSAFKHNKSPYKVLETFSDQYEVQIPEEVKREDINTGKDEYFEDFKYALNVMSLTARKGDGNS